MQKWQINIPIYNINIHIIYSKDDIKSIDLYLEDTYNVVIPYAVETTVTRTYTIPNGIIVLGFSKFDKEDILHECSHAIFEVQDLRGLEGQENFCYLQSWLYFKVLKLLNIND